MTYTSDFLIERRKKKWEELHDIEYDKKLRTAIADKIIEEKCQIGKYFPMKYSTLLELLMEAENKKYINLNNNFGNRFIEFTSFDYSSLLNKYYKDWDEEK